MFNHKGHQEHKESCSLFVLFVLFAVSLSGCDLDGPWPPAQQQKCWQDAQGRWHCPHDACRPQAPEYADVPVAIEQKNWTAPNRSGSCMWAASATVLRWFGQYPIAQWWVENHGGGCTADDAAAEAQRIGLPAVLCSDGDPAFLDWCDSTRRVAAIHYPWIIDGRAQCHAVVFAGWRDGSAVLRDDNGVGKETLVERNKFLEVWRRRWSAKGGGEGRAWTLLAPPAIPRPW
jgi:hypothetical protein